MLVSNQYDLFWLAQSISYLISHEHEHEHEQPHYRTLSRYQTRIFLGIIKLPHNFYLKISFALSKILL